MHIWLSEITGQLDGAYMSQLQICDQPVGSVGHRDSMDVGAVTGLVVCDSGGCGSCFTEQGGYMS